MQYQKGALSREEATDKILHRALKSRRRQLFKHDDDDDDDDVQGAEGRKESENDEEFFYTSDVIFSPEDRERALIRKNIQTDKVFDSKYCPNHCSTGSNPNRCSTSRHV